MVDIGGGHGPVSFGLAKAYPKLNFIVQDLATAIESNFQTDSGVVDRVQFMNVSFLEEQPVKGADVYFLRAVFHNYPDAQCIKALEILSRAMDSKSLVMTKQRLLHRPGEVSEWDNRLKR